MFLCILHAFTSHHISCSVRNPHKTVASRATRAMVRQLHKDAHTDLEIADHLSISPAAVRSVIQNESGDNEDSDDEHVVCADGLSDEAMEELCEPRMTDLDGIPFSTKMDEAGEQDIPMKDLDAPRVSEPETRDGMDVDVDECSEEVSGIRLSNSPVLQEPTSFQCSPSHSPKPTISPIQIPGSMDGDSDSDIEEVQCSKYLNSTLQNCMLIDSC